MANGDQQLDPYDSCKDCMMKAATTLGYSRHKKA